MVPMTRWQLAHFVFTKSLMTLLMNTLQGAVGMPHALIKPMSVLPSPKAIKKILSAGGLPWSRAPSSFSKSIFRGAPMLGMISVVLSHRAVRKRTGRAVQLAAVATPMSIIAIIVPIVIMLAVVTIVFVFNPMPMKLLVMVIDFGQFGPTGPIARYTNSVMSSRATTLSLVWSGVYVPVTRPVPAWVNVFHEPLSKFSKRSAIRNGTMMMENTLSGWRICHALVAARIRAQAAPADGLPRRLVLARAAPAIASLPIAILGPTRRAVMSMFLH